MAGRKGSKNNYALTALGFFPGTSFPGQVWSMDQQEVVTYIQYPISKSSSSSITIVDKADFPRARLVALQDTIHKMEVSDPLEGSDILGLFQNKG
jgi:hypothetical protein